MDAEDDPLRQRAQEIRQQLAATLRETRAAVQATVRLASDDTGRRGSG